MNAEEPLDGPQAPPTGFGPTLLRIGPGLVLAGSIVGSGELIATIVCCTSDIHTFRAYSARSIAATTCSVATTTHAAFYTASITTTDPSTGTSTTDIHTICVESLARTLTATAATNTSTASAP